MSGIGLGLQAAQMEQSRNQQAQELAFRQQQAGINNAQEDRRFDAAQAADIRDFDAMQQWRAFQRQQQEQQYKIQRDEIARDLASRNASAMIFKAASMPPTGPAPGGVGPVQPHAIDTIPDATIMQADSNALRALMDAKKNNAAYAQRREVERQKAEAARADGSIRNISPEQADVWRSFGFYYDGTIGNDEMPLSMREQEQQRQEALASFLATERDANGNLVSNPQVFDHYRSIPLEYAELAFNVKLKHEAAMEQAQLRAQNALEVAGVRAQGRGPGSQPLTAARFKVGQAEKEYRALTGQSGKMGTLTPPSKSVEKSAEDFAGGTGHWFKFDSTQERHVRMVNAWEKYQQALAEYDQAATEAYNPQQRGILDGPNGSTPLPDENVLIDSLKAQGLSVDEIEAKMMEMGYQ